MEGGALVHQVEHAFKEQGAKMVIVRLENDDKKVSDKLLEARRKVTGRILYYRESEQVIRELF